MGWFKRKPDPRVARLEQSLATVMGLALKTNLLSENLLQYYADTPQDQALVVQIRRIRQVLCDIAECDSIPVAEAYQVREWISDADMTR